MLLAPEEIGARERAAALAGLGWAGSLRCGAASAAHPVTKVLALSPGGEILPPPPQQQPEAGALVAGAQRRPPPVAMAGSDEVNRNECKVRARPCPLPHPIPAFLLY